MATLTLPADSTAQAFARAGESMLRRLANVQASIGGLSVVGLLATVPENAALGGLVAQASLLRLDCLLSDLPVWATKGAPVNLPSGAYVIAQRTDLSDLGQVTLHLERA